MTIADIAKHAGVSTATVSRVINHLPVSIEKRVRVEESIAKLDYRPNPLARGLMKGRSHVIGLLTTSMSNQYYMEITEAIERKHREQGYMNFLCCTEADPAVEKRYVTDLMARQVDGIIIMDPEHENYHNGFHKTVSQKIPLVLIHSNPSITDIHSVMIDQPLGMTKVVDHLTGLGHRRIAFLRGKTGFSYDIKEDAWRTRMTQKGLPPTSNDLWVIEDGNSEQALREAEEEMTRRILLGNLPDAVFACNDLMALGVIGACERAGVKVPEELSVVGHDNTILAQSARFCSVDLKMRSLGLAAVDLLSHAMAGGDPEPRRLLLVPDLVLRPSVGAPRLHETRSFPPPPS